jgi:photosystem II stability/assembly factor-like uncharacterized protein
MSTPRSIAKFFLFAPAVLAGACVAQTPALPAIAKAPPAAAYHWRNVVIRAGGFVSGIEFSPALDGLVYARTDVGGAYRSDDAGEHWTPITDQFPQSETTYLGIESIAPDPEDANKVYVAAGMYTADWGGPAAIFRSNDKGRHFEKTAMPFKMGGNDDGRGVGERMAVDPNLGSVIYFGSRKAGLWRSVDAGVTWAHVDSFPVQTTVTGPGDKTGLTFVAFDKSDGAKGAATKTIYVGVAQAGAGLYRSTDAGATWAPVPGAPKDLFPTHAAVDPGNHVYFSYVDNVGPNGITTGAIWSLSPKDGKWKDVSPVHPGVGETRKFGFGGLAMDAEHPDTLMVTTLDEWWPADQIFRTTNGGRSWKELGPSAVYSAPDVPWVYWHKDKCNGTGWMNAIAIDPFHPGKVMYTTGEGIFGSADVTNADAGKATHWGFPNVGLEELVVNQLVSPPVGAPLISVVSDLSGYRHEDLDKSPRGGMFDHPFLNTETGLDMAGLDPMVLVRVGYGDAKQGARGAYSTDQGVSWKAFASEPPGSKDGAGRVAISADGKTVVWQPEHDAPFWTADWGRTWNLCQGLNDKTRVVSDRVNPLKFYSFHNETGQLLESFDGGRVFQERQAPVSGKAEWAEIAATPGREGDIWISAGDRTFHSTDSGLSFVELQGMAKVNAIGFGKPAAGKTTPVVFMNGVAANVEGLFRSDDEGVSWLRVDDPEHQFGWKNAISGDPRVYGRLYLATGGRGVIVGEPVAEKGTGAGR